MYQGMDPLGVALQRWIDRVLVGNFVVDVDVMRQPPTSWGSRTRSETHVKELMKSFTGSATINQNIMLVDLGGEPDASKFDVNVASTRDLCAVTGDHTRVALIRLSQMFPRNPRFKQLSCKILCPPNNQETFDMLRLWGTLDNFRRGVHLREQFRSVITKMHEHLQSDKERGVVIDQKRVQQLKANWVFSMKLPKNTIGAFYQIARRTGMIWKNISLILSGQVAKPKTFKIPQSPQPFIEMSKVPDHLLTKWLREVVSCEIDCNTFRSKCVEWKNLERIRVAIISHLTTRYDLQAVTPRPEFRPDPSLRAKVNRDNAAAHAAPNWQDGVKTFPRVCNTRLLLKWQGVVSKLGKKEKVPPQIFEDVDTLMSNSPGGNNSVRHLNVAF